jgi:Inositol phosphatase
LGNVSSVVFEEFESNLMSGDPAVSMPKLREQAIEMCQKMCVPDEHEELIGGWTLLTPQVPNTVRSTPFEESVLLLTDVGLYSCRFDWNLEKVSSFERVDLQHIASIKYGTYITSTLSAAQTDEQRNVGIVITYSAGADDITRTNSRSLSNIRTRIETDLPGGTPNVSHPPSALEKLIGRPAPPMTRVLALKALSTRSAVAAGHETQTSEIEHVRAICSEIERMILHGQVVEVGTERKSIMESGDIITLSEARKSTGLLEQLGHSLKKLVWA